MRKLSLSILILFGVISLSNASTRSDVKVLEASENIKYITQKIAKNYLYFYDHMNKSNLKIAMNRDIKILESNMRDVAIASKSESTQQILDYFAYEKEQFKVLLKEKPSIKNANEILDISDALSEGAIYIGSTISYNFSSEEKMLMNAKSAEYLSEKIDKYYMVLNSNIDQSGIVMKMQEAIEKLDAGLSVIEDYDYPTGLNNKKLNLKKLWNVNKNFYAKKSKLKVPSLLLISSSSFRAILEEISTYHSRGQ